MFALLEPDIATRHADVMTAAAEAGDFDEWPTDERGLRLDMAIRALAAQAGGDGDAYARVLPVLGALVEDVDARRDLWDREWRALLDAERRAREGALEVARHGNIAVFLHRPGVDELPGAALSRRSHAGATRWLLAFDRGGGGSPTATSGRGGHGPIRSGGRASAPRAATRSRRTSAQAGSSRASPGGGAAARRRSSSPAGAGAVGLPRHFTRRTGPCWAPS